MKRAIRDFSASYSFFKYLWLFCFFVCSSNIRAQNQSIPQEIIDIQAKAESIGKANLDSVLLLLDKAEALASEKQLTWVMSESAWVKSKTYYALKEYASSREQGRRAIQLAKKCSNYDVLAKTYNLLGIIERRDGDYQMAITQYKLSMENRQYLSDSLGISKTLQNLGNLYREMGLADSAFNYFQRSIDIKEALRDTVSLSKTIANLGSYYFEIGEYQRAIDLYAKASKIYHDNGYEEGIGRLQNNIGAAYTRMGYYQLALTNYIKALNTYQDLGMQDEEASSLSNVANLFKQLGNYDEALANFNKSLNIYKQEKLEHNQASVYLGMGEVALLKKEPETALHYFSLSKQLFGADINIQNLAVLNHGFGRVYTLLGEYERARSYYHESIKLNEQIKDHQYLGEVYSSLAVMNYELKEYKKSMANYQEGLALANQYKLPVLKRSTLIGLAETNEALGNLNKAYDFRLQYESIKDSIDNVDKSRQLAELKEIYESEQKDKQISQLELENEVVTAKSEANAALAGQQKTEKLIVIVVAFAILIMALILYLYYRQRLLVTRLKVKEEKELHDKAINTLMAQQQTKTLEAMVEAQEKERKRIAKELHDHFGSLMAAVKVNLTSVADDHFITAENNQQMKNLSVLVDKACEDVRSLSHQLNVGISEGFGLVPALQDLADSISQSERVKVQFLSSQCDEKLDSTIEVTAYRLVQELVSNALKHSQATKITVQLTCLGDLINLIVEDNGVGFDSNKSGGKSGGIGLKSMRERIAALHGDFEVDSQIGKGTTVIIDLPTSLEQNLETV